MIRRDLSLGDLAAQLTHAAGESATSPVPSGTHAVILSVPTEQKLLELELKLINEGIEHRAIREPDEPFNNQITAIGLVPTVKTPQIKKVLSSLPLLR